MLSVRATESSAKSVAQDAVAVMTDVASGRIVEAERIARLGGLHSGRAGGGTATRPTRKMCGTDGYTYSHVRACFVGLARSRCKLLGPNRCVCINYGFLKELQFIHTHRLSIRNFQQNRALPTGPDQCICKSSGPVAFNRRFGLTGVAVGPTKARSMRMQGETSTLSCLHLTTGLIHTLQV